jgi:hypothetical protein
MRSLELQCDCLATVSTIEALTRSTLVLGKQKNSTDTSTFGLIGLGWVERSWRMRTLAGGLVLLICKSSLPASSTRNH